ncbi:cellulase family glycosylhydrolase [Paenibacillus lignilyticus]|uniref:Cellulase family glycosylhydrolase n=1 Tax=Paenibacillus lignilyticus TaxID=1172615 RepID=A0ABS5CIE5_9BACL|nr:cellulase family glycosylhydrolase [Paenibacillus lignilyticus]MBP3965589.1 cellulase family glycosylhydrolase [Paenibacillus lignilyticus]
MQLTTRRTLSLLMVMCMLATLLTLVPKRANAAFGDRITVSGTQFMAGGKRIWMNAANTPWNSWNDFGGSFNATWWGNHFKALHDNGVNATRVWITCDGEVGINIAADGTVSGATAAHWSNLDTLFQLAQQNGIYIMATLISFDHFKNTHSGHTKWRNMINSSSKTDTFVNNYIIPFVNRYKNNPYLWSIDLTNEPDWIYEDAAAGQLPWNVLQRYFAKAAVAIHNNSQILVTVGMAMIKYNSDTVSGAQGNKISNAALQAQVNNTKAKVDFYSVHYYDWMGQYWGNPFYMSPASYGLETSKPAMLGETPGVGTSGHTLTQDYENGYLNGWQGAQAWTSNGVDSAGNFSTLTPATNAFRNNHTALVFPS